MKKLILFLTLFSASSFVQTVFAQCAGNCGNFAGGCACDDDCWLFGDCCPDMCTECPGQGPNTTANCGTPPPAGTGCNTDISICSPGVAGPFGFAPASPNPSSCLDYINGDAAPNYAYIILYITQAGSLNLLLQGDAGATGCLDVSIFDITGQPDPCASLGPGTEIGCNYASDCDGCSEFGSTFPGCLSEVPAPFVNVGDVLMILVEDYSDVMTNFTIELGTAPGSAQTGPGDPTINPAGPFLTSDPVFTMTAANGGGTWSASCGACIDPVTGDFDPAVAGDGVHQVCYDLGAPPCEATDCIDVTVGPVCSITGLTANVGACVVGPNTYSTTGQVTFINPPAAGQLTVTDCNGVQQVFNAPFVSPIDYNLTGQNANGLACDITAVFTANATCTANIAYVAPVCLCNIDNFSVNIGSCEAGSLYTLDGTIDYSSAPAGGTLIVEVDNGTGIFDTIINSPFTSPDNFSISGIPADGAASTVTVYFSDDPACTQTINYTATAPCNCSADIGTFTTNITGSSTNDYVLCFGDQIDITTNNDWVEPGEMFAPPGPVYDPGVSWLIYSCPPTVALVPDLVSSVPDDPCFLGLVSNFNLSDFNDLGMINAFPAGTFTDNTIYYVPITMYSMSDGTYSYVNTDMPCYELGPPYAVQYLPDFTFSIVQDCNTASSTVTLNGGLPAIDGSNFTASSLLPVTASFANTTAPDGGTIVIDGLQGGEMYSFTVTDGNGCPYTVNGGPFPLSQNPSFNYPANAYCVTATPVNPVISGVAGGSFSSLPAGLTLNAATGQITPTTSTAGTYNVTYTTPGPCPDDSTVVIDILDAPVADAGPDVAICPGGTTTLNGSGPGIPTWAPGATLSATDILDPVATPAVNTTYTLTLDLGGCIGTDDVTISILIPPVIDAGPDQVICEGDPATLSGSGAGVGGSYTWDNGVTDGLAFSPLATLTYTVTGTDINLCTGTDQVTVTVDPPQDPSFNYPASAYCITSAPDSPVISGVPGGTFASAPAGLTLNAATGEITPATSTPGAYSITYTTPGPCPDDSTVVIDIVTSPVANAGPDVSICPGDNTVLDGSGPGTPSWAPGATLSATDILDPIATPAVTTTYTLTLDVGGCIGTDDVTVTINVPPVIDAGPDQLICTGEPVTLSGSGAGVGGSYTWDNSVTDGVSFNPGATLTYTVTGTDANLCEGTDQVTVTVNPPDDPSFNYPLGSTYCQTSADPTPTITGLPGGTFSFVATSGGPFLDLDPATGTVSNLTSDLGTYDITYNTAGAPGSLCPQTSTVTLTITDAPEADFSFGIYCANDADPLPTFIGAGSAGVFSAAPAGLSINPATGLVDLDASTPGTYTVTNTVDVPGCALVTFDDDIVINGLPAADISGTTSICPADPLPDITINITAGAAPWDLTYNFNGAPVNVVAATTPLTISGASAGSYDLVSVTDGNGCTSAIAGNATISLLPVPVMNALNDQDICADDNLVVQNFGADIAGSTFDWTNDTETDVGFGLSGNGNIAPFVAINGTNSDLPVTVTVTPTSPDGCVGAPASFVITVHPLPAVSFTSPAQGCAPLMVTFDNTSTPPGANCVWNFGNGVTVADCGQVSNEYSAGMYNVTLTVTTADGCTASLTNPNYVIVSENPVASFTFSPDVLDIDATVVEFQNNSLFADTYEWDFGDESPIVIHINPDHIYPPVPGEYIITLIAFNNNGACSDTMQQYIVVQDVIIFYVPNVFTPDHDEFNEGFLPVFTSGFDPFDYHLMIFNRWGEVMFESYDASQGWDGTYSNQGLVQDGVYVWQIEFKETMSDKRHTHRGHVTVLK